MFLLSNQKGGGCGAEAVSPTPPHRCCSAVPLWATSAAACVECTWLAVAVRVNPVFAANRLFAL